MTNFITGGTVSVEDCVKHAGYPDPQFAPTRKVRVELTFDATTDGSDGQDRLDLTAAVADAKVKELLGSKPTVTATSPKTTAASGKEALAKAAGVDEAAVAAATAKKAAGSRAKKPEPTPPPATTDAAAVVDEATVVEEVGDEFAVTEPEPPREITDAELHSGMTKKNGELKNPVPIRAVVAAFKPAGHTGQFTAAQIPQAQRQKFLDQLAALKAA